MGFFKVDRALLEHELWLKEPFTKGQAWLDMVGRANYEDNGTIKRGQFPTSALKLAERWQWHRSKVRRFLDMLVEMEMIAYESSQKGIIITILNYEKYQKNDQKNRPTNRPTDRPTDRPTNRPTDEPTNRPTESIENSGVVVDLRPTDEPTNRPTDRPTNRPTDRPTNRPLSKNIRNKEYKNININKGSSEPLRWGVCNNVYMTMEEVEDLMQRFPDDYEKKIDKLSTYMRSKGVEWKYQDHYATILMWASRETKAEKKEKEPKLKLGVDI